MSDPPVPLPRPNPYDTRFLRDAYQRCVDLESRHDQVQQCGTLPVLIAARLIGFLLLEAPTDAGREYLASEILQCDTDEALQMLIEIYTDLLLRFICPIKKCLTPPCSINDDFSFECAENVCSGVLDQAEHNHLQARENALVRDRYRCPFCGHVDSVAILRGRVTRTRDEEASPTALAHIVPVPINQGHLAKENDNGTAITALSQYGQIDAVNEPDGDSVHYLENVITLNLDCRQKFNKLYVWLERYPEVCYKAIERVMGDVYIDSKDPVNHYRMASTVSGMCLGLKDRIVFTTPDAQNLVVPDPRYLALHSAFARAAHFSGAQQQIEFTIYNIETGRTEHLKNDENSVALYAVLARRLYVEYY